MSKRLEYGLLVAVVGLALALRLWQIGAVAPSCSDEAMYLRQARFMHAVGLKTLGLPVPVADEQATGLWRYVRKHDWYDKPCWMHSAIVAAVMVATGPRDLAGALANTLFSVAAVVLLFWLGRRLGSPGPAPCRQAQASRPAPWLDQHQAVLTGWLAALLLGVSGYWLVYSRGMWAEVDSVFFVLLAYWLAVVDAERERPSLWLHALAGVAAALAVLCHYRQLSALAPLGLAVMLMRWRRGWVMPGVAMAAGVAGVLIGVEVALQVAVKVLAVKIEFSGLFGALYERFTMTTAGQQQSGWQPQNIVAYGWYLVRYQGVAATLLAVAGVVAVAAEAWRCRPSAAGSPWPWTVRRRLAVVVMLLVPLLVLMLQVWVVARAGSSVIPFVALLGAMGAVALLRQTAGWRAWQWAWAGVAALLLLSVASGAAMARRLAANRMGHQATARFLMAQRAAPLYGDPESLAVYAWYEPALVGESVYRLYQRDPTDAALAGAYVVFDGQCFHMYPDSRARLVALEQALAARAELVFTAPSWTTAWPEMLYEGTQAQSLAGIRESVRTADQAALCTHRVYRLK